MTVAASLLAHATRTRDKLLKDAEQWKVAISEHGDEDSRGGVRRQKTLDARQKNADKWSGWVNWIESKIKEPEA